MAKNYFDPVDLQVNFPELEKEILAKWDKKKVVKKYLNRNSHAKKYFSFLDGPITANNPMGVHHAWGRTYKDLWQRFKNMQGFRERFQNGFDCQGLWVEVEVEKELGFRNKKDIEAFGVDKFVQLCKDRVKKYSNIQTEQSKRLGYFMDWENSYYTLSDDNNYMIWHFLKVCNDYGWIYKGQDSVAWCPRCETAISQHEILTEDYKELNHESVFLAFPVTGQNEEYLLVWTTTPWTVPANVAVAVNPDLDYSQVEADGKKYWVAKESKDRVFAGTKVKEIKLTKGSKLVGLRYKGAFDAIPAVIEASKNDKFHTVVATDDLILPINTDEGTGMVHVATSAGAEDFKLGKKFDLPVIKIVEDDASYMKNLGFLSGQNAKKHPEVILDFLKKLDDEGKHFFFKIERYTHRYPACWRCKTELIWKVADEWYISMDKPAKILNSRNKPEMSIEDWNKEDSQVKSVPDTRTLRERMKDVASRINWIPGFGLDREMDWLTNMHDWLISKKNRYWGLALPIWECKKCHLFEIIGSKEELKERAVAGWGEFEGKSPHKPQIDGIKIKCRNCGAAIERIEPVGNPWLDAGVVSFSTISSDNKSAGFIPSKEKPLYLKDREEWLKWFPADFITESFPGQFKNWFYSLIAMSTVLEDVNPYKTVLGFGTLLAEDGRPMHKSWGNSIEFNEGADKIGADVMRWIFARANPAENMLFGYKVADEVRRRFHLKLWNVYNFFVTYANLDKWTPGIYRKPGRTSNVLDEWILTRLNQMVNVVTDSLEKFDAAGASLEIEKFVDDLSLWYIRRSRDRVGPAKESDKDAKAFYSTTYYVLYTLGKILAPFMPYFSEAVYTNLTHELSVHLADWPKEMPAISDDEKKLIVEMEKVREIVEKVHAKRKELGIPVRQPLAKLVVKNYKLQNLKIEKVFLDEINVKEVSFVEGKEGLSIDLDEKITPELKEESDVRDLIRKIQEERKRLNLNLTQKVDVVIEKIPASNKLVQWMLKKAQISHLKEGVFMVKKAS
ncbi:MAG: Isoleucyl-tRNA synthetase [Candidatus Woesebacteria bacterium GW2011_GWA1_41_7]|uniref:Isoleucine--tRNA ligase n=2 Tax=Candidatus Woeseibacteriota TaxID=1752722 RepID=A0A0G0WVD5_9BACT|nr:MAG: Isoleucyl-tRNA synthetase [Candidatus Woesebacteria bacterium GW2011_GWA1_41_7]